MKTLGLFLGLLLLTGCGYKPSAYYAKNVLGEKVYVEVVVSASDPENAVIVKDALLQALISRFRVKLKRQSKSDTQMRVKMGALSFTPIEFDESGYVVAQRCVASLSVKRTYKKVSKNYGVSGSYDFAIEPNGVVSETQRFNAIRFASLKAIDALVTQLAVEGSLVPEK